MAAAINYKQKRGAEDEIRSRPLYLDSLATTPLDPRVNQKMLPYLVSYYGNPHSNSHAYGWQANDAVEKARQQVANLRAGFRKKFLFFKC